MEKAINILDLADSKADTDGVWDMLRRDYTSELAIKRLAKSDLISFYKIISECPEHLVSFVKIRSIKFLVEKNKPLATDIFQTLSKDIAVSKKKERIPEYLAALDLSAMLSPSDSVPVFRQLTYELDEYIDGAKAKTSDQVALIN